MKKELKASSYSRLNAGRSMIEMLGVLAVIGVLSIGGLAGFRMAMNRHQANEILNLINLAYSDTVYSKKLPIGHHLTCSEILNIKASNLPSCIKYCGLYSEPVEEGGQSLGVHMNEGCAGVTRSVAHILGLDFDDTYNNFHRIEFIDNLPETGANHFPATIKIDGESGWGMRYLEE